MKKIILTTLIFLSAIIFTTTQILSLPTGAAAPASGGPAEGGVTCSQYGCHSGSVTTVSNVLVSDIPVSGYTPGATYNLTVTVTGTGWKGFMVSAQNASGTSLGTLIAGTQSKITFTYYITHSADKSTSPAIWTFKWKAPAAGTGDVTFYGAFAITKYATQKQSFTLHENTGAVIPPVVTTLPSTNITSSGADLNGTVNTNGKSYTVSFQYKTAASSWLFLNANPSTLNNSSPSSVSLTISSILPNTLVTYRACAWNVGDTTWGTTQTFSTSGNTGIDNVKNNALFNVFPNPATTNLNLTFELNQQADVKINLLSLDGKTVYTLSEKSLASGSQLFKLDLSGIKQGIYFLQLHINESVSYQKVLVD